MTDVRVILDTSAILAYSNGSIDVGEIIAEIADEPARFAVPLPCLLEAACQVDEKLIPALQLLVSLRHAVVVQVESERWRTVAGLSRVLGRIDLATALLAARDNDAHVVTAEPDAYGTPGGNAVIRI